MNVFKKVMLGSFLLVQAASGFGLSFRGINDRIVDVSLARESNLGRYFSAREIDEYNAAWIKKGGVPTVAAKPNEQNRLTDPAHNRCGDNVLPAAQCPEAQKSAWKDGTGCINGTEYDYAVKNAIAPLCAQWAPTQFVGWCRCGCFEKSTQVLAQDSQSGELVNLGVDALNEDLFDAVTMTEDSTLFAPIFERRDMVATTVGTEEKPLVWVHTEDGTSIGLTEEHAVLTAAGTMIAAKELVAGEHQLVSAEGQAVSIKEIQRVVTNDPVYNLLTDAGLNHKGHMVIANGLIVGDIMWQNTLAKDLQRVVVRM